MIGQRLKLARSASGLSLRGLSDKIENLVSAQAISYYERDETTPGSDVLLALAVALDVSLDYLVGNQDMTVESIDFRKKKITRGREVARVEATILHDLERYLAIENILGLPGFDWDKPREAPTLSPTIYGKPIGPRILCTTPGILDWTLSRTS